MRRIPRPSRAIDPSAPFTPLITRRLNPTPCRAALVTLPYAQTAAFTTTPSNAFLLSGKQDKKKHQQMVRRWQKRLLGDSEPIGAHVDPYDPTSPVRIAPEEQGEEVEVLVDENGREIRGHERENKEYHPANNGFRLRHVGGQEWIRQREESSMAKEFEKLTLRTYTPLNDNMANKIEDLTGTPYTLRDDNLMMAQSYYDFTGLPYTNLSFGRIKPLNAVPHLRKAFHQALVEIYTLKQAGKDMDVAKLPNRGVYNAPKWIKDVKLHRTDSGELALTFPKRKSVEALLSEMEHVPSYTQPEELIGEELLAEEGEIVAEDAAEPAVSQAEIEAAQAATPETRRAALVKGDDEKKPFDFMSNRPVPRAKLVQEAPKEEVEEKPESTPVPAAEPVVASTPVEPEPAPKEDAHAALEAAADSVEQIVSELRESICESVTILSADAAAAVPSIASELEISWYRVPLADPDVKFALSKRLIQLTGLHISDPYISSAKSLGELYSHLRNATKPKTNKLHSVIHIEAAKANRSANLRADAGIEPGKKAPANELLSLGNVSLHKQKITPAQKRREVGLEKVYRYATAERGLKFVSHRGKPSKASRLPQEGTRAIPEFGQPLSAKKWRHAMNKIEKKVDEERQQRLKGAA
ncbi:hypothetical protein BS50DRAFT_574091 [Corynespora cassiicola Philippines]|uniref:Large ribosomal subunit protein mL50 n=1 Tax=Corynespora cassiicola Philippines TaxID=1448308 RepID=A0A2T2NPQ3_CORCC|nr:hypothetical protein BS50DRAFT_574091 [Corynespora cassiicola Philippines]